MGERFWRGLGSFLPELVYCSCPFVISEQDLETMRAWIRYQPKLYTNHSDQWRKAVLQHPASFKTLAMDPVRKEEIMSQLDAFGKANDYYRRIGEPWKKTYLFHGPQGTGKSTMIIAMAKYMDYDTYKINLTTVETKHDLWNLLMQTTSKSIIAFEDIDCSLEGPNKVVTMLELIDFINGLWSAGAAERLIIFTTKHREKLDPKLIRRGQMDMIEMPYCGFEAFKVLAHNYLGIDSCRQFEFQFELIKFFLRQTNITPADVKHLMSKSPIQDPDTCLSHLIDALITQLYPNRRKRKGESIVN